MVRAAPWYQKAMSDWTRERLVRALDGRDPAELQALVIELEQPVVAARALLFHKKPWLRVGPERSKEDDVQTVLTYLFNRDARVLRKFGDTPDFVHKEGALRRFVMGVTMLCIQKLCRKRALAWELLEEDMASTDQGENTGSGIDVLDRLMDARRAVDALSPSDQELFALIYDKQLAQEELCEQLGISAQTYQQRKSRLLRRLAQFLRP